MAPQGSVDAFLAERDIGRFAAYHDPDMKLTSALGVQVMPTTILYDAEGKEVWRYVGDLDWTSAEAAKLLAERWAAAPKAALSRRPSIAARPSAIRASPAKSRGSITS